MRKLFRVMQDEFVYFFSLIQKYTPRMLDRFYEETNRWVWVDYFVLSKSLVFDIIRVGMRKNKWDWHTHFENALHTDANWNIRNFACEPPWHLWEANSDSWNNLVWRISGANWRLSQIFGGALIGRRGNILSTHRLLCLRADSFPASVFPSRHLTHCLA